MPYIDWTPFFQTWELKGRFPQILDDEKQGAAARALYEDAQAMLKRIVEERWFQAKAVIGFWPANAVGDDIHLYAGESRQETIAVLHTLRQQLSKRDGRANTAMADFVAPRASGVQDYVGAFVVTAASARTDRPQVRGTQRRLLRRSWRRRWPTGWRRPSPNSCT